MEYKLLKIRSLILLLFLWLNIFKQVWVNTNNCDKVANIPPDFELLLPNYQKLNRFHLLNYFFLEPEHPNFITISIKEKSVFKFLAIPKLADMDLELFLPSGQKIQLKAYEDIPVDYVNFNLESGVIKINFLYKNPGENLKTNKICNSPFFQFEILLENQRNFISRNQKIRKDISNLDDFQTSFEEAFEKVSAQSQNLPLSMDYDSYRLSIKEKSQYKAFNVSIIAEFDLNIEDKEHIINSNNKNFTQFEKNEKEENSKIISKKYLINFDLFTDFLYGGGLFFALVRKDDINKGELANHNCLFNEKCILAERANKNQINLQTIVTPGQYKILIFNFLADEKYQELKKQTLEIPVSAKLEIKNFEKEENRYNCPGRHLPSHLNFLKDKYSNDYLEYSGDIIMNTEKLFDEITFFVEEDSLLRIVAFAHSGENIDLELYHIPNVGSEFENLLKMNNNNKNNKSANLFNSPLGEILSKIFAKKQQQESSNEAEGTLKQISEHFGQSDGMYLPLMKGNTYKVVFSYRNSIFAESERKSCEMFYLKIALAKLSHIKSLFPNVYSNTCPGANDASKRSEIRKILKDFENENRQNVNRKENKNENNSVYDSFSHGFNTVFRTLFDRNNPSKPIFSGKFQIKNPVNINVEILSDFTSSFIVPVIIPDENLNLNDIDNENENLNFEQILNHKHNLITFHENHIKLNLPAGYYRLIIINGLSQFYNENDTVENSRLLNFIDLENIPKCLEFQIRISAQKLLNSRMANWQCNSKDFEFLPSSLNTLLYLGVDNKLKQKFSYFSKHLLVPLEPHVLKLKTSKEGYLLRLVHEFADLETAESQENISNSHPMEISLLKSKKILKSSKPVFIEDEFKTTQQYLTHYLKPNTEYEILFEFDDTNKHFDYFANCKLFKMEISLISEKLINNESNNNNNLETLCAESKPSLEEIAYERIIGLTNSFFRYGSKSILQMFLSKTIFSNSAYIQTKGIPQEQLDLEISHPQSAQIQFLFDPKSQKAFTHSYNFEVRSSLARVTIAVETPYSSVIGISFKLFFIYDGIEELVAFDDMDEQGYNSLKGVQLEIGKYRVEFYANNLVDYKKDFSIFKNYLGNKKICVNFSANILIENRPFDFFTKHVSDNYLNCPYNSLPQDLNIPGWLAKDTGYNLNIFGKFKINPNETKIKFKIYETSLFKFHIPDEHDNIFNYIDLFKLSGNSKKRIKEKLESKDNYINMLLEKGSYQLDFTFRGVQDSKLNEEKKCLFFEAQLIINPVSNTLDNLFDKNYNNNIQCSQNLISNFEHNSFKQYLKMQFLNEKTLDEEKTKYAIKLDKSRRKGNFIAEIILNPYLDSNFKIKVFEKKNLLDDKSNSNESWLNREYPAELVYHENVIWLFFHTEAHSEYFIQLIAESFDNLNICSSLTLSYSHTENQKDSEILENKQSEILSDKEEIKNENLKKNSCKIYDHLPAFLFSEKNTKSNSLLKKYGGPQAANGLVDIYGEFLLPNDSSETRTTFYISTPSIIYVKVIPKYAKEANVYIEVYRDKNVIYRYSHNDYMGILLYHLEASKSPYILNLTFDKNLEDIPCGSYELVLSIVPKDIYKNEYLICDQNDEKIMDYLLVDKPQAGEIDTHLNAEKDDFNNMIKTKEGNFVKKIKLELKHSYAAMLMLQYIDSDNYLDIALEDEEPSDSNRNSLEEANFSSVLEIGASKHSVLSDNTGILTKKVIAVNLKKGNYVVKITFHKMFRNLLRRTFKKDLEDLCLNFQFEWEFSELHLKHDIEKTQTEILNNSDEKSDDELSSEINLHHINKSEITDPNKISVLAVQPPTKRNIKIGKNFEIEIKFSQPIDLDKEFSNQDFLDFCYFEDQETKAKIYPYNAEDLQADLFKFSFNAKNMQSKKCYLLKLSNLENPYYNKFEDDAIEHKFCMEKCDCNINSDYKCGKNGECICRHPYTGRKCEECATGFVNINGRCEEILINCDDNINCSGHGKCITDVTLANLNSNAKTCLCDIGFASYSHEKNVFCNTCANPKKNWPFCLDKNEEQNGSGDGLIADSNTPCEDYPLLPKKLFDEFEDEEIDGNLQDIDGSINLSEIFKVSADEEITEILIPENSVIRIFYHSFEINNAKVLILENKYDENPIAYSDGKEKTESFIARLAKKNSPYVIKILHFNLKSSCNKYKLRISIMPINQVESHIKCSNNVINQDPFNLLPMQSLVLQANANNPSELSKVEFAEKEFFIAENLILDFNQNEKNEENKFEFNPQNAVYTYTNTGMLSKANFDEPFIYNIKLDVRNSFTFSLSANYDFLTSDINIALRDSTGKVIKYGKWAVQDDVNYEDSMLIRNEIQHLIDPGVYYLTIKQNVPANHLLQIINDMRTNKNNKNNSSNSSKLCFGFNLNLQYNLINKPDKDVNTAKFESMFNRILNVSPTNISNIRTDKKFKIIIEFEDPILNKLRYSSKTLKDVFYLQNIRNRNKIEASSVYLQGGLQKAFLVLFEKHALPKDECFELIYNLDLLVSEDKEKKILSDKPLVHKYCTKSCNCNPHTHFNCGENGECQCEQPYTGKGCFECVEGYMMVNFKCITQENCDKNFCSSHGSCQPKSFNYNILTGSNNGENIKEFIYPSCKCDSNFAGNADCSACSNINLTFPDCELLKVKPETEAENKSFNAKEHRDDYNKINKLSKKDFEQLEKEDAEEINIEAENAEIEAKCNFPFVPFNLDSLGYLHLDGKLHLARKYSFKHFAGSHYSTSFTIKSRSHLKIHLEHSKSSHIISIFLLNNKDELIENGELFTGPAGLGSASYLDIFLDPLQEKNNLGSYKINFYIKDVLENEEIDSEKNFEEKEDLKDECFNAFMELAILPAADEAALIAQKERNCPKTEKLPYLIGDGSDKNVNKLFDYHTIFYENLKKEITKYTYIRDDKKYNLTDVVYFYHDYFYVPDHFDQELVLEIQILSEFINSHVGVLLEIVELPLSLKIDHKKITSQNLKNLFSEVKSPICEMHCFTAVKKENSVLLSRLLPSDTYFRIWFYDVNPIPSNLNYSSNLLNICVQFEMLFDIKSVKASSELINDKKETAICQNDPLPVNLNIKGYLGDSKYIEKWGFHILDSFRIDNSIFTGLTHETLFELKEFHILRLVVFHGRVDTDIELFYKQSDSNNNINDYILLARSNAKNFEDVIVLEIPPGQYKIVYKFFPPSSGFHKCEAIKLELSMNNFRLIQENVNRMVAKHKNKPVFSKLNLVDLIRNEKDLFSRDFAANRYVIPIEKSFFIDKEDINSFEPSIIVSEMSFSIDPADESKLELYALVQSDFLYLDAAWYLTEMNSKKIITAMHKKNMNVLSSGPLEAGTYVLTLRYYRRLHSNNFSTNIKDVQLLKADFAELDVNLSFINRDNDLVSLLTSDGYVKIPPRGAKHVSHNWLCRNKGIPIPKSLDNLRYLEFNTDMHILDSFLVPTSGEGEEIIKFRLKYAQKMMLRVYVECHFVDIDIQLRELIKNNDYKILAESKQDVFFETVMALIKDNTEYEIVLIFKGTNTISQEENIYSNSNCKTFKMEIALEANHNYACPESDKYRQLTDLKIFPKFLPLKENKIFSYDSRKVFLGEDKDSGYLYMIRKDYDVEIKFSELNVESEIDFKLEILHDFMQSPLNIFLVREQEEENLDDENDKSTKNTIANLQANILKNSGINNSAIIDFGEIFENRSSLIVKNLPAGKYAVYLFLPALKTTFISESRVCAIYDVIAEAKKSRGHFREKEIASTAQIKDDNLDTPAKLPLTLNTFNFLESDKYVNNHDFYFLRRNVTNSDKEIINTISFTIEEESLCEFSVEHDLHSENIFVKIEKETDYKKDVSKILAKGAYEISIKLENVDSKNYLYDSLNHLVLLFVGISPVSRVKEIYSYNNLLSSYHQCQTSSLPAMLKYNTKSKSFFYHVDDFKLNVKDLSRTITNNGIIKLGKMNIALNSAKNRILIEIGSDLLLNNLSVAIISESKKWESSVYKNNGFLDVVVPKGKYAIELQLISPILVKEWECIIFSLDVHVIDLDNVKDPKSHFKKHIFDTSKNKENAKRLFLQPKCNGEILPIRISQTAENENAKIDADGEYNIHLNSALYFDSHQISKQNENLNEIALNIKQDSLVRVTIYNLRPKNFVVVPKIKQRSLQGTEGNNKNNNVNVVKENILIRENIELVSHNKKERNIAWFVEKNNFDYDLSSNNNNLNINNDDYLIQLEKETGEKFTDAHNSGSCPIYGLDISVNSLVNLSKKFSCPLENGKVLKYILPQDKITKEKFRDNSYHEIIEFSYITESQYSEIYTKNKQFDGFEFKVDFEISEESHLKFEIGYDNSISLFDAYVVQYDLEDYTKSHVIATSDVYFNKAAGTLLFRRIIDTTLYKGRYSIIILESIWSEISRDIRSYSGIDNHLCLPFEYKLDLVSINHKNAKPEIYSVFPPGAFLFKAKDEDINIRVSLSKTPFTHQHKQITNEENFMNIVEAFYFRIVPNKNQIQNNNSNNNNNNNAANKNENEIQEYVIYPDKVYGSSDGKSWDLLFLSTNFESDKSYKLEFDNNWIFDANYSRFILNISLPTFRIETKKEEIFAMADNLMQKKNEIQEKDKGNLQEEQPLPTPPSPPSNLGN